MIILRYFYSLYAIVVFVLYLIVAVMLSWFTSPLGERRSIHILWKYCHNWAKQWAWLCGVRIRSIGAEKMQANQSYVIVANHSDYGDIIVLPAVLPNPTNAIGKKEVENIPIMNVLFKKLCVLVDRADKGSRRQSVDALKARVVHDVSLLLFPEGTFSNPDKEVLLPFYSGAFRIAIDLQLPVLPLAIVGARTMLTNGKLPVRPGEVTCFFADPIPTNHLKTLEDADCLKEQAYDQIYALLVANDPTYSKFKQVTHSSNALD